MFIVTDYAALTYCLVCSLQPCCHMLGKGWPLDSLVCGFLCFCHFPIRHPRLSVILDCIDFWSLPSALLYILLQYCITGIKFVLTLLIFTDDLCLFSCNCIHISLIDFEWQFILCGVKVDFVINYMGFEHGVKWVFFLWDNIYNPY